MTFNQRKVQNDGLLYLFWISLYIQRFYVSDETQSDIDDTEVLSNKKLKKGKVSTFIKEPVLKRCV